MEYWKTNKTCPKCKSNNFQIVDYCQVGYIYECENGIITPNGQDEGSSPSKRVCVCRNCNYQWHPKGDVFSEYHSGLNYS